MVLATAFHLLQARHATNVSDLHESAMNSESLIFSVYYPVGCPRDCSGHGQCVSVGDLSRMMAKSSTYRDVKGVIYGTGSGVNTYAWDYNSMHMCLCDSTWPVGINAGERQLPEFFGPDCSQSKSKFDQ